MNSARHRLPDFTRLPLSRTISLKMAFLRTLYSRADDACENFAMKSHLRCPKACGSCCIDYIPHILPIEAEYIALHVLQSIPELAYTIAERGFENTNTCPFFEKHNAAHCAIYKARPLVCRTFGFSGVKDKDSEIRFRLCKHMGGKIREWSGVSIQAQFGCVPPAMTDFAHELTAVCPGDGYRGSTLTIELPIAMGKLLNSLHLESRQEPPVGESGADREIDTRVEKP